MDSEVAKTASGLWAIIPAHNEGTSVGKVVRETKRLFPLANIVAVDDGSTDDTGVEASRAGASVLTLPFNLGYGVALQTGLICAHRNGAKLVVTLDADGQHSPEELAKIIAPVASGAADLSLGSRYRDNGARYRVPIGRRLGAWVFSQAVSVLTGLTVTDPTTGFQCLNEKVLELYANLADFPDKTPDADLILYAIRHGCRLAEVPVVMFGDEGNDSMHGYVKSFFYVPKMLTAMLGMMITKQRGKDF